MYQNENACCAPEKVEIIQDILNDIAKQIDVAEEYSSRIKGRLIGAEPCMCTPADRTVNTVPPCYIVQFKALRDHLGEIIRTLADVDNAL